MEQSKACSRCEQILPYEAFGKIANSSTGRRSACNVCRKAESKSYRQRHPDKKREGDKRYYLANMEKIKAHRKQYRQANAEYIAEWQKVYRANNADKIAEMKRAWRKRNADWADDASKRWQAANQDLVRRYKQISKARYPNRDRDYYLANTAKFRAASVRRRAKEAQAKQFLVTNKDIKKIMIRPCIYCGAKAEHLDHVIPIAKGGLHSIGNLAPACARCNLTKGAKFVTVWRYR